MDYSAIQKKVREALESRSMISLSSLSHLIQGPSNLYKWRKPSISKRKREQPLKGKRKEPSNLMTSAFTPCCHSSLQPFTPVQPLYLSQRTLSPISMLIRTIKVQKKPASICPSSTSCSPNSHRTPTLHQSIKPPCFSSSSPYRDPTQSHTPTITSH